MFNSICPRRHRPLFDIVNRNERFPENRPENRNEQENNRRKNRSITGDDTCFPGEGRRPSR